MIYDHVFHMMMTTFLTDDIKFEYFLHKKMGSQADDKIFLLLLLRNFPRTDYLIYKWVFDTEIINDTLPIYNSI